MFTYFNEAFRKIMVNIHFLKSDNFPTLTLKIGILYFIKSLSFGKRMPISTINFYHNMVLWQGEITGIFANAIFNLKGDTQFFKSIVNNQFWFGRAFAVRAYPCSETLPRAKAEFMKFGRLYPYFLTTPFTFAKLSFPKRVRNSSNGSFEFVRAFTTTKFTTIHFAFVNLIGLVAEVANKCYLFLSIPSRFSPNCFVCFKNIYFGLGARFANSHSTIKRSTTGFRAKFTLAFLDYRRSSIKLLSTIQATDNFTCFPVGPWQFSPIHTTIIV